MNNSLASSRLKQVLIINPILIEVILTVNFTILTEAVGIVGIVGNVISILNFRKQGYKDGVNVTLTALAVSDLESAGLLLLVAAFERCLCVVLPHEGETSHDKACRYSENREAVMNIYYLVNALFFPNLTILMLMVFTVILITKLKSSNPQSRGKNSVNYKERNAIAMLATMSGIYIVCVIPRSALLLADGLFEEMKVGGIYFDLNKLVYSFLILFEAIN
uniref:G-protein coupled receptors family 1 profile domain-containing protein n=1 Tax=Biomphalaria glabrata TaxID=6526 RepID=A0A2C9LG46_BIOGL